MQKKEVSVCQNRASKVRKNASEKKNKLIHTCIDSDAFKIRNVNDNEK